MLCLSNLVSLVYTQRKRRRRPRLARTLLLQGYQAMHCCPGIELPAPLKPELARAGRLAARAIRGLRVQLAPCRASACSETHRWLPLCCTAAHFKRLQQNQAQIMSNSLLRARFDFSRVSGLARPTQAALLYVQTLLLLMGRSFGRAHPIGGESACWPPLCKLTTAQ